MVEGRPFQLPEFREAGFFEKKMKYGTLWSGLHTSIGLHTSMLLGQILTNLLPLNIATNIPLESYSTFLISL